MKTVLTIAGSDCSGGAGIQASADEAIWQRVWTKEERINNASTPMFLVEGWKRSLLQ